MVDLLHWIYSDGQAMAADLFYAPLRNLWSKRLKRNRDDQVIKSGVSMADEKISGQARVGTALSFFLTGWRQAFKWMTVFFAALVLVLAVLTAGGLFSTSRLPSKLSVGFLASSEWTHQAIVRSCSLYLRHDCFLAHSPLNRYAFRIRHFLVFNRTGAHENEGSGGFPVEALALFPALFTVSGHVRAGSFHAGSC